MASRKLDVREEILSDGGMRCGQVSDKKVATRLIHVAIDAVSALFPDSYKNEIQVGRLMLYQLSYTRKVSQNKQIYRC